MFSLVLDSQLLCDLEMLLDGSFAPLTGFLCQNDFDSVLSTMHLANGELWPMPIVLPITSEQKAKLSLGQAVWLCNLDNTPLAELSIQSIWLPDREAECKAVFSSVDRNHPFIDRILSWPEGTYYVGGPVKQLNPIQHFDFGELRRSPKETRTMLAGKDTVVGFQTRNPMHRSHFELSLLALKEASQGVNKAHLLLQPVVGITQPCDVDYHTRVRCYQHIIQRYPLQEQVTLALLPLSMRMAGPREAVWHALIRKNYGCTHFVVGRDHAGPSYKTAEGNSFFSPYAAQNLVLEKESEIGLKIIVSKNIVYSPEHGQYFPEDQLPEGAKTLALSGTEQRRLLQTGEPIPEWFSFPEVVAELRKTFVPKHQRGLCLYLIGLSGAGKSTLARALQDFLLSSEDQRQVSILDGDIVRRHLSKGLGFSPEDRSTNVRRIGFVASEIVKHRGIVICANIAPFEKDRSANRSLIESQGGAYIEIWLNPGLTECQRRDVKGHYSGNNASNMTGVGEQIFEEPSHCDLELNTQLCSVAFCLETILLHLRERNLLSN